jgi:hypothetical protein
MFLVLLLLCDFWQAMLWVLLLNGTSNEDMTTFSSSISTILSLLFHYNSNDGSSCDLVGPMCASTKPRNEDAELQRLTRQPAYLPNIRFDRNKCWNFLLALRGRRCCDGHGYFLPL